MSDPPDRQAAPLESERRRYLTILFSDLSHSTILSAAMEAEDYADLVNALHSAYRDVVAKHGGSIVQIQGDGMIAIFGYPEAREDDGRRAVEAALDLHDIVRQLPPGPSLAPSIALRLHSGIHSGLVLLGKGDSVSGRFALFGSAANVASRISDVAESDEILVGEETLGAESHFFQTGEPRRVALQGVAEPVTVFPILARADIANRFEARAKRGLLPLVGRQAELRALGSALADTLAGRPRYAAVVASNGMGKTRLTEEFLRRAVSLGCRIHRGYCESYLSAEPLQPVLQVLRALFGLKHDMRASLAAEALERALTEIHPELAVHGPPLAWALSLAAPGGGAAQLPALDPLATAVSELFAHLAANQPQLLFVDDWQWADDATRQVVGAIRNLDRPIFVLIAARELDQADPGMSGAEIVQIAPLSAELIDEAISRLLPGADPFVVAEIA
jgi:class 3 adenylate cyclase